MSFSYVGRIITSRKYGSRCLFINWLHGIPIAVGIWAATNLFCVGSFSCFINRLWCFVTKKVRFWTREYNGGQFHGKVLKKDGLISCKKHFSDSKGSLFNYSKCCWCFTIHKVIFELNNAEYKIRSWLPKGATERPNLRIFLSDTVVSMTPKFKLVIRAG